MAWPMECEISDKETNTQGTGVAIVDFSRGSQKIFPWKAKSGKTSFFPLKTKKTTFFC